MSEKITIQDLLREYQELPEFQGKVLKSVHQQGGFCSAPIHIAVYRERSDEVRLLLEAHADPNAAGEYGERPIQIAINCGNKEIIEQLLRAGARTDLKDNKNRDAWRIAEAVGFAEKFRDIVCRVNA